MKKGNLVLFALVITLSQACNSGSTDSVEAAKDANASKDSVASSADRMSDTSTKTSNAMPVDKMDADFAVEAANGGMMEVELGKYAQDNATSPRIKSYAAMIVKDHTKANDELKAIAAAKNITLPTTVSDDVKKHMDDMMKMKGKDFDNHYMKMMLDDHKKDIKKFETAAADCKDMELKTFAGKTLPTLKVHLDSTMAISGKN